MPFERLEARVAEVAAMLSRIPLSQLQAQKLIVNQAYENMGLASTQTLGGILDGLMRNTPTLSTSSRPPTTQGVRAAVERRDGPLGDYSQAPPELRPDPRTSSSLITMVSSLGYEFFMLSVATPKVLP